MQEKEGTNNLLQQLVDQLPEAAFVVNQDQMITAWNDGMAALTGLSAADMISRQVHEAAADIYGHGIPALVTLLANGQSNTYSWMTLSQSDQGLQACFFAPGMGRGKGALVQANARLISDDAGKIIGAVEMVREFSLAFGLEEEQEIRQAAMEQLAALDQELHRGYADLQYKEKSIIEAERRFRSLLESMPLVAIMLDLKGTLVFANAYALELFGVAEKEIIGREFISMFVPPSHQVGMLQWIELARFNTAPRQGVVPLLDTAGRLHRLRWVSSLLYTPEGDVENILILGEDVTIREETAKALKESEATLRQIADNMTDLISRLDRQGRVLYASPSHFTVLGYQVDALKKLFVADLVHPDDVDNSLNTLRKALHQGITARCQQRSRHANGSYIWTETVANPLREDGQITGVILSSRDITERKKLEDDLRFLSVHDPLTGLYNRTYFETEMERLNNGRFYPVGIVVCDLDGLKLVNDTLGHAAGDRLLKSTAMVLKQCFRQSDVVSRVGGDEFAILLPGSDRNQLEMLVYRIYEGVGYYNQENPDLPLSLSVGTAVCCNRMNMRDAFKEADNEMYRVKLNRTQSARSAVVHTLMKALEARDYITEGHAERLQELVVLMGRNLGLSDNIITSLRLLAQFHDIGKVGVPDRILFKPGLLTEEEFAEMKRHCEIGHRIALASPELSSLAELILKHHEWWNGQGYPSGLRGKDIPLECRILALADAYDAMTSNRPYRKAMSSRDALREIENFAGIQFDPVLADIFIDMLWDEQGTA